MCRGEFLIWIRLGWIRGANEKGPQRGPCFRKVDGQAVGAITIRPDAVFEMGMW